MLDGRNGKVNKTSLLIKSFGFMGKVDRRRNTIVTKSYSKRKVQKNKRVCLILPEKNKKGFTHEVMLAPTVGRKDKDSVPSSKNSIAKAQSGKQHSSTGNH